MSEMRYYEDIMPGEKSTGAPTPVTEVAILAFARDFDPQPMHTDPEAAATERFDGLIASGWHMAALAMRDFVVTQPFGSTLLLGMRTDVAWIVPVRPGDMLTAHREVISKSRSHKLPDYGRVVSMTRVENQDGATVMTLETLIQIPTRGPAPVEQG